MERPIRVLLVDDEDVIRDLCRTYLESHDDVEVVGEGRTGAEAVELARSLTPDVVLMDVHMPDLDGVEATRLIKQEQGVRVLLLTSDEQASVKASAREAGADDFLQKGIFGSELIARVRALR